MTYPCGDCGGYDECECEDDPTDEELEQRKEAERREREHLKQDAWESMERWEKYRD